MTTFQLREICTKERILQGVINPMDKEELVHTILRYKGADEYFLIQRQDALLYFKYSPNGESDRRPVSDESR